MPSKEQVQLINQTFINYLTTPGMEKKAVDAAPDFTRFKLRERGFLRKIIPPENIGPGQLDRWLDSDLPLKIVEMEPDGPPAITIPFNGLPVNLYIKGPRYPVFFNRLETSRFTVDVEHLYTYDMDIRQILSDNAVKDMMKKEDETFLRSIETALGGPNQVVPFSGIVQWKQFSGGLTRNNFIESLKIMGRTVSRLEPAVALLNATTVRDLTKWNMIEAGGNLSENLLVNGWDREQFHKVDLIISINRDIVPDDRIYYFARPEFLGKLYVLTDVTMFVKREHYFIEYFCYETIGCSIGNLNALAIADFI
jgi:hypothetical protein